MSLTSAAPAQIFEDLPRLGQRVGPGDCLVTACTALRTAVDTLRFLRDGEALYRFVHDAHHHHHLVCRARLHQETEQPQTPWWDSGRGGPTDLRCRQSPGALRAYRASREK